MIPRTHRDAVSLARLTVSEMGGLILPYVTGMFRDLESERHTRVGIKGAADTIACYRGQFYAIEVKVGRDVWRPEQQSFAKAVEAAGGRYVLARWNDKEDGVETIRCLLS